MHKRPSQGTVDPITNSSPTSAESSTPINMHTPKGSGKSVHVNRQTFSPESSPAPTNRWTTLRNVLTFKTNMNTANQTPNNEKNRKRDSFIDRFTNQRRGSGTPSANAQSPDQNREIVIDHKMDSDSGEARIGWAEEPPGTPTYRMNADGESWTYVPPLDLDNQSDTPSIHAIVDKLMADQSKLRKKDSCSLPFLFQRHSKTLLLWLSLLSVCVLYNLWIPIARQAFYDVQVHNAVLWFSLDAFADLVYVVDFVVQMGSTYLNYGLVVIDRRKLARRYIRSSEFYLDLASILPLDLIQIQIGMQPMLRFPRFIKIYRARQWKILIENRSIFPNMWRVLNLTHVLFLGFHWFACVYYLISRHQNFSTTWGLRPDGMKNVTTGRTYLRCYYWATLALTTIGIEDGPITNIEYIFTSISYLLGLFAFATVVGQVGNIINTRNAARVAFEAVLDSVKSYMRCHSVDQELQKRILRWYDYAWQKKGAEGTADVNALKLLPDKLRTELALHVNLETLRRVEIFQECRPEFLHDLVLKMKPYIFTPGDYVCRKGEVAREMFIIAEGVLEVLGSNNEVWSRMCSGDFFGEIGILNLDGQNRRTADVRAVGYTDLFVLSRADVLHALQDHPEAEIYMMEAARKRLDGARKMSAKALGLDSGEQSDEESNRTAANGESGNKTPSPEKAGSSHAVSASISKIKSQCPEAARLLEEFSHTWQTFVVG